MASTDSGLASTTTRRNHTPIAIGRRSAVQASHSCLGALADDAASASALVAVAGVYRTIATSDKRHGSPQHVPRNSAEGKGSAAEQTGLSRNRHTK